MLRINTLLIAAFFLISCDNKSFKGSKGVEPGTDQLAATCNNGDKFSRGEFQSKGLQGTKIRIDGEFCNTSLESTIAEPVEIVHVIDYSGSMADTDSPVGGTCDRLKAARAFTDNFKPQGVDLSKIPVFISLVGFGTNAKTRVQRVHISQFAQHLTSLNYCYNETINSEMSTNYEWALTEAMNNIQNQAGRKEVLFLSDGLATARGVGYGNTTILSRDPSDAEIIEMADKSKLAAEKLRAVPNSNLYFGIIELDSVSEDRFNSATGSTVEDFFIEMSGYNRNRVALVDNSADLVNQLNVIEKPDPVNLESERLTATLSAPGFQSKTFPVTYNYNKGASRHPYTVNFVPFGRTGEVVVNTLVVEGQAENGQAIRSTSVIQFKQETL